MTAGPTGSELVGPAAYERVFVQWVPVMRSSGAGV